MFVQSDNRGFGIGKLLLTECIEIAKKINYDTIKLDTADFMKSAIQQKGFASNCLYFPSQQK